MSILVVVGEVCPPDAATSIPIHLLALIVQDTLHFSDVYR